MVHFTKMHGIGNDYVYVNAFQETVKNPSSFSKKISDRHFGIGSDGLIMIAPSDTADFQMIMYNADGSRGEMCGNGIRCVGKYVYDRGMTNKETISVETLGGIKHLSLNVMNGRVHTVRVNMGKPKFQPNEVPFLGQTEMQNEQVTVNGCTYYLNACSMGNPHCVIFMKEDVRDLDLMKIGPQFENFERFPERVNTEFVNIIDTHTLRMRVWERGSGETLACGTGACASVVEAIRNGFTERNVTVQLLGGDLEIYWDQNTEDVFMTGSASTVFDGEIDEEN